MKLLLAMMFMVVGSQASATPTCTKINKAGFVIMVGEGSSMTVALKTNREDIANAALDACNGAVASCDAIHETSIFGGEHDGYARSKKVEVTWLAKNARTGKRYGTMEACRYHMIQDSIEAAANAQKQILAAEKAERKREAEMRILMNPYRKDM